MRFSTIIAGFIAVLLPVVSAVAVPDSSINLQEHSLLAHREDDNAVCGYAFSDKGLRGQPNVLKVDALNQVDSSVDSAQVISGCTCEWFGDRACNGNKGYSLETGMFQGDFAETVHCFRCYLSSEGQRGDRTSAIEPAAESTEVLKREDRVESSQGIHTRSITNSSEIANELATDQGRERCGWVYTQKGLRGDTSIILTGRASSDYKLRSAIVAVGYTVRFFNEKGACNGCDGYEKKVSGWIGDFSRAVTNFECVRG